ncbi:putative iso-IS10R ORF [Clostridium sp. CAG:609]|nr:putative iso-IS10R ORF [Clostridium sp. CAG:609]
MNKLYNTQSEIANKIREYLKKNVISLRKTQLNIIPEILFGMISAESVVTNDIAKVLKDDFSLVQLDSVKRRIRRFFNNELFCPEIFYKELIIKVITTYKKKHKDKRIHISFDHMFSHDNYIVLMFTMRIGNQGIPIWFRAFKQEYLNKEESLEKGGTIAFNESLIIQGIREVSAMFDEEFELIFLADRWFNSEKILKEIEKLGHTYCIRLKRNIKIFIYDKKEKHKLWKWLYDLPSHKYHAMVHKEIELYDSKYKTNIVISKYEDVKEPWIIVTNRDVEHAVQNYSHRFGSIECVFKNQKSNGLFLEAVNNASEKAFKTMYTLACTAVILLTLIGADYSKNLSCYKSERIVTHKTYKNKGKVRVMSLFKTGLTLFHRAHNSRKYIRLPIGFVLYDI